MAVHIRPHKEAVPGSGSFEVWFSDGRRSVFFYYDEEPGRRLRPDVMTKAEALEAAKAYARKMRETG